MPDKEIWIDGVRMLNGTSIKVSKNTETSSTTTFDGVITEGNANINYSIECNKVTYESKTDYVKLRKKLDSMLNQPAMITIRETHRPPAPEKPFTVVENYQDCLVDGGDYEIKPDERTVDGLKFVTGAMKWYTE